MRYDIGSGRDLDRARADRDFRMNPPAMEPGQGSEGWKMAGDDSYFSNTFDSTSTNGDQTQPWKGVDSGSTGATGIDAMLNNTTGQQIPGVSQMQNQNYGNQQSSFEDNFWNALLNGAIFLAKLIWKVLKTFGLETLEAVNDNKYEDRRDFGSKMMNNGFRMAASGFGLWILAHLIRTMSKDDCLVFMIAGLISSVIGAWMYFIYKFKVEEEEDFEEEIEEGEVNDTNIPSYEYNDENGMANFVEDNEEDEYQEGSSLDEVLDWGDDEDEDEEPEEDMVYQEDLNIDSMIDDLDKSVIPENMFTRQYLFETFMKVLPRITPRFQDMTEIPSSSDDFIEYEDILREAAEQIGVPEDKLPNLIELRENLFIVQLKVERTCNGKEQAIADEVVSIYQRDEYGAVVDSRAGAYATVDSVGNVFFINLYIGANVMVSLGDIYSKNKDFMLDTHNVMPYVWGINEFGKVLICDIKDTNSFIISGSPRAGKSWKVQSLLLQMCMFNSPDEINIYVCDTKARTSDYYRMSQMLPHFKGFHSTKESILKCLRYITGDEVKKRRELLAKYDEINIKDLKADYPEVKMPYIYIVIDEMQALNKKFTREESEEFQRFTSDIVSSHPNIGYRVILIPHRITNEVISKLIYPLINCRACVMSQFDEMKNGLEITRKDFKYSLPNKGDMALRTVDINNNNVVYCHGDVISSNNSTNNEIYRYVGEVWKRLLPGCEKDSVGYERKAVDTSFTDKVNDVSNGNKISSVEEAVDGMSLDDLGIDDGDLDIEDLFKK